jgi:predicted transcriptional regulator
VRKKNEIVGITPEIEILAYLAKKSNQWVPLYAGIYIQFEVSYQKLREKIIPELMARGLITIKKEKGKIYLRLTEKGKEAGKKAIEVIGKIQELKQIIGEA